MKNSILILVGLTMFAVMASAGDNMKFRLLKVSNKPVELDFGFAAYHDCYRSDLACIAQIPVADYGNTELNFGCVVPLDYVEMSRPAISLSHTIWRYGVIEIKPVAGWVIGPDQPEWFAGATFVSAKW